MKKVLFGVAGAIIISLGAAGYYSTTLTSTDKILNNIYVANVNVGDMTKEEALKAVQSIERTTGITISMKYQDKQFDLDASEFGYGYDVKGAIEKAYETGRTDSFISNMMTTLSQELLGAEEKIEPPLKLLKDDYNKAIDKIAPEIETPVVDASVKVESGQIILGEGTQGIVINRPLLKTNIKTQLEEKELFRVDQETNYAVEIPVETKEQTIKVDSLNKVTGIIGEYTTKYNAGNKGRDNNITIAAQKLNDKMINPGETLSYNETIGPITYENGYMDDTVIVNGEIEQGVGGGVCQVSSTLYNSALYANMEIVQRRNHSVPSNYTPISRDAVISYNTIDLVIKNPYDYPLVVKAGTNNGSVTIQIYGNVETAPKVTLDSEIIGSKARGVTYIDDPSLPVGTEKVKTAGRDEIQGRLYKTVNGVTTTVTTDTYPAKNKVIIRGTKKVNPEPQTQPQTQNTPNTASDETIEALIGE